MAVLLIHLNIIIHQRHLSSFFFISSLHNVKQCLSQFEVYCFEMSILIKCKCHKVSHEMGALMENWKNRGPGVYTELLIPEYP